MTVVEVAEFQRRMRGRAVDLAVDDSVVALLTETGFDPVYGSRGLRRALRTLLAEPVADVVLRSRTNTAERLSLAATVADGEIVVA